MRLFDEVTSLGEKILSELRKRGLEGDVYCEYTLSKSAKIQNNKHAEASQQEEAGVGVRVIVDGRMGFYFATPQMERDPAAIVDKAIKIAKLNSPIKNWVGLPTSKPRVSAQDVFSPKLLDVSVEDLIRINDQLLAECRKDPRIFIYYASIDVSYDIRRIMNTHGVDVQDESTVALAVMDLVASEAEYSTPSVYSADHSRIDIPDVLRLYEKCREEALTLLKPRKLDTKVRNVVFTHKAFAELLEYTLGTVLTARAFALKRSPFIDKVGTQVFSRNFTLIDDPLMPGGYGTSPFDDEAVESRRLPIIENGVIKNIISNLYWASIAGLPPTGHGYRAGYRSLPEISYTNTVIESGNVKLDEILNSEEPHLLVDDLQGAHSSNPESGEFSVAAPCAWIVKKGEKTPVTGVMLSGNIYEALKNIELTVERFTLPGLLSPYVIFRETINVISK